jgi:hypothetical protein
MERGVYADCPMDDHWGYGYEDYEWFWRLASTGHKILYAAGLDGAHHHRQSFRALAWEYLVSANGCATFVRAYPGSPLARKRHRQATLLPIAAGAAAAGAAAAVVSGQGVILLVAASVAAIWVLSREVALAGRLEAMAYVLPALALGSLFVFGLGWRLFRSAGVTALRRIWARPLTRLAREFPSAALQRLTEFEIAG